MLDLHEPSVVLDLETASGTSTAPKYHTFPAVA
jgi:hypothetical protein